MRVVDRTERILATNEPGGDGSFPGALAGAEGPRMRVMPSRVPGAALHVVARVNDPSGALLGAIVYDVSSVTFDRVLRAARAGESGETYAFDASGRMLSESRFADELARIGLIAPSAPAAGIMLRDPGRDLRSVPLRSPPSEPRPLTRMAASAVAGSSGMQLEPYRDYRGVNVVGAWRFLPELGLGIATEVDAGEVYGTLREVQRLFRWLVVVLAVVCSALLAAVAYGAYASALLRRGPSDAK
jgi:hypothetical protein